MSHKYELHIADLDWISKVLYALFYLIHEAQNFKENYDQMFGNNAKYIGLGNGSMRLPLYQRRLAKVCVVISCSNVEKYKKVFKMSGNVRNNMCLNVVGEHGLANFNNLCISWLEMWLSKHESFSH